VSWDKNVKKHFHTIMLDCPVNCKFKLFSSEFDEISNFVKVYVVNVAVGFLTYRMHRS